MTPAMWSIVWRVGVAAALLVAGWNIKATYAENKQLRAEIKSVTERVKRAEDANVRQDTQLAERELQHQEIRAAAADITVRIKQETSNDPQARALLGTRIPDSVRRGYAAAAAARAAAEHQDQQHANGD